MNPKWTSELIDLSGPDVGSILTGICILVPMLNSCALTQAPGVTIALGGSWDCKLIVPSHASF